MAKMVVCALAFMWLLYFWNQKEGQNDHQIRYKELKKQFRAIVSNAFYEHRVLSNNNSLFVSSQTCWTIERDGFLAQSIPSSFSDADRLVANYDNLDAAKTFCELLNSECSGISRVYMHYRDKEGFRYLLRNVSSLQTSVGSSSWIKDSCKGDEAVHQRSSLERSLLPGFRSSSVPVGFFPISVDCASLGEINRSKPIEQIFVWGERNSGTTLLEVLMGQNTHLEILRGKPWKHFYVHMGNFSSYASPGVVSTTSLNLFITKDIFAWLLSMYKEPHHFEVARKLTFEAFLLTEWAPWGDPLEKKWIIYSERHANIFQLRAAKLLSWLAIKPCLPSTDTIRYEDLNSDSGRVIKKITKQFNLELKAGNQTPPCVLRGGACGRRKTDAADEKKNYYLERKYLEEYDQRTIELVKRNIDVKLEATFGYDYGYVDDYLKRKYGPIEEETLSPSSPGGANFATRVVP